PANLSLSATLVADPARSPGAALDRLDAEIESLPHQADPAEIVRIAGTSVIYADTLLALEAYLTGQWDEAQRLAEAAAELCEARGYQLLRWKAQAVQAFLAAGRGDAALAQALADEKNRWAAPRGVRHLH